MKKTLPILIMIAIISLICSFIYTNQQPIKIPHPCRDLGSIPLHDWFDEVVHWTGWFEWDEEVNMVKEQDWFRGHDVWRKDIILTEEHKKDMPTCLKLRRCRQCKNWIDADFEECPICD